MSRLFEELKRIAKEEFDCTLIEGEKKRTFSDVFGFEAKDIVSVGSLMEEECFSKYVYTGLADSYDNAYPDFICVLNTKTNSAILAA